MSATNEAHTPAEPAVLDWSGRGHWRGGLDHTWSHPKGQQGSDYHGRWIPTPEDRRSDCRLCGRKTFLSDDQGRPCHKVCAEQEIDQTREPGAA